VNAYLADQLHRDDLAVGQRGQRSATAEAYEVQGLQFVVHKAKYLKQKFLRGHKGSQKLTELHPLIY
jgi:hypothetical protein